MAGLKFTKMQGAGNDYVYIDCFSQKVENPSALAVTLSDRHFGIGGDGIILIEPSEIADCYMHMFNNDGSEGDMCGNGSRCVAKYIADHGLVPPDRDRITLATKSGIKEISVRKEHGRVVESTVDMGEARCTSELPEPITVAGMSLCFIGIDVGNPHAVYFLEDNPELKVKDLMELDFLRYGRAFECHERFPDRVNSEFIEILSRREVKLRVYERGTGETLACGTGTTAAVAAGIYAGKLDTEVLVHLRGGDLYIRYDGETEHFFMTGPAAEVFHGTVEL